MRKALFILTTILLLIPSLASADSVTATVDSKCTSLNATFTVPAGKTATNFSILTLEQGVKCTVGGVYDSKGWGIILNGNKVYYWNKFKNNAPTEIGGPLNRVSLPTQSGLL